MEGLLFSQIGYCREKPAAVVWRSSSAEAFPPPLYAAGLPVQWETPVSLWGSHWFRATLPTTDASRMEITAGSQKEQLSFGDNPLWEATWRATSYESLERRAEIAKNRRGWADCGGDWQEANSHACCLQGLVDLVEFADRYFSGTERQRVQRQIAVGADFLAWYQDLASRLPGGKGGLIHESPAFNGIIVPSDVSKAALAFARVARFCDDQARSEDYRARAKAALRWLRTARPCGATGFSYAAHGVDPSVAVPEAWMTRDLLAELGAYVELALMDETDLPERGNDLVRQIVDRQWENSPEGCTYPGQFATFPGWPRPEPAWTHFLGKDSIGNDVGATQPHWLVPLVRIAQHWPGSEAAAIARRSVERFAYGYFLPACRANPFFILPLGEFPGEGLLWFAGLWHGMNSTYAHAASLAWEFRELFQDPAFDPLIEGNLQWIAGLNSGIHPGVELGCEMSTPDTVDGVALPVCMIYGIGRRYFGSWRTIRGSIGSGFTTGRSFRFDVPPRRREDAPSSFSDEDWITFNGAWLGAIARLRQSS